MKTKFGSFIISGAGKLSGNFFSSSHCGTSLRSQNTFHSKKPFSSNSKSILFSMAAKHFHLLSASDRVRWNNSIKLFPHLFCGAPARPMPVYNFYLKSFLNCKLCDINSMPIVPVPFVFPQIFSFSCDLHSSINRMWITVNNNIGGLFRILVYCTKPVPNSTGINRDTYKFLGALYNTVPYPLNIYNLYNAAFPGQLYPGRRIFFKFVIVHRAFGIALNPFISSGITY